MEHDLGKCIVTYAEIKAKHGRRPTWSYVGEILSCGATSSVKFCYQHLEKIGWKKVIENPPPEDTLVYACESLGDQPTPLKRKGDDWFDKRNDPLFYKPTWWKERGNGGYKN